MASGSWGHALPGAITRRRDALEDIRADETQGAAFVFGPIALVADEAPAAADDRERTQSQRGEQESLHASFAKQGACPCGHRHKGAERFTTADERPGNDSEI